MTETEFEELAVGHVLHALSAQDETRFRAALAAHPEWARMVDAALESAALFAEATAPVSAPESSRSALLTLIAETAQDTAPEAADADGVASPAPSASASSASSAEDAAPRPRRWTRAVFALAACLALIVGIGFGAIALNDYLHRPAAVVALQEIEGSADAQQATVELDGGGTATAHWSQSRGSAVLVTDGIPALAEDQAYELWFVRGETAISAGVFDVEDGSATALLAGDMQAGDIIAVTVEQAGGSPDGAPSSDPIIAIPTA